MTTGVGNSGLGGWRALKAALADLSPASFGLVMATGIIAMAAFQLGWKRLAHGLLLLNLCQYGLLWLLYGLRACWHPRRCADDLITHATAPGYFTIVAASGIVASQCIVQLGDVSAALGVWLLTCLTWLVLTYGIFGALMVNHVKPTLRRGINGAWLLAVVATQAVVVSTNLLALHTARPVPLLALALALWLCGGMLYIWLMTLIFYRHVFFRLNPEELSPPFWISMGAMAISTLAGAQLISHSAVSPLLTALLPFVQGMTLLFWASGSWWIPMLLLLGVWRHGVKRYPLRYDPLYWGIVFPLGMYAVGTREMATVLAMPFLDDVVGLFYAAGLLAWGVTFSGMVHRLWSLLHR